MVSYFHLIQLHWVGCHPWSTMPPWYALPVLHVGFSSICWHLFWSNWGHKFHSIYPESITLHPARPTPQPRISIASTGLKYQNLMEYDCMRDSSKRWKNQDFPHIPYYHIPEDFTSEGGKMKRTSSGSFPRASERRVLPVVGVCKTSSHLLIFTSSHLHIFHPHIFTSSHLHICSSSHLHIFSSSHVHILSCPLALLPSCVLLLFYFFLEGGSRGSGNETARNATLSHEMRFDRQKLM